MFQIELLKDILAGMKLKLTLLIADRKTLVFASRFIFYFFCRSFVLFMSCVCQASRLFAAALWSPSGKGLTSLLLFMMFIVFVLLSYVVSWIRCST